MKIAVLEQQHKPYLFSVCIAVLHAYPKGTELVLQFCNAVLQMMLGKAEQSWGTSPSVCSSTGMQAILNFSKI